MVAVLPCDPNARFYWDFDPSGIKLLCKAAMLIAQSLGGGLPDIIANLTAAMEHPFRIHWTDRSLVTRVLNFYVIRGPIP